MFRELVPIAALLPRGLQREVEGLANELGDLAVLPVIGAGASVDCSSPSSGALARNLYDKLASGAIAVSPKPSDLRRSRSDLGKMADAAALAHTQRQLLEGLGFEDTDRWPSGQDAHASYGKAPWHACAYRVLARMAKESFLTEGVTFNYDCHFEGALLKEGFFPKRYGIRHNQWPEVFSVVANARSHASVSARGEFVLNKVHGCVETWRQASESEKDGEASDGVVLKWTQLLDWREDRWSRDLFRDRARSNVLLILGFSGVDAVIQSTLQAVMRDVATSGLGGPSRIRIIDLDPRTLALTLLARAGQADAAGTTSVSLRRRRPVSLAAALLALHVQLVVGRLEASAAGLDPHIPVDREARFRRIAITAPAMLRWTWTVLASGQGANRFAGLRDRRDDYYVPLCADQDRTRRAFAARDRLAELVGVPPEADTYTSQGSFVTVPARGKAYMPVGLLDFEIDALARRGLSDLTNLSVELESPAGRLDRLLVALHESSGQLRAFSLESGSEVPT